MNTKIIAFKDTEIFNDCKRLVVYLIESLNDYIDRVKLYNEKYVDTRHLDANNYFLHEFIKELSCEMQPKELLEIYSGLLKRLNNILIKEKENHYKGKKEVIKKIRELLNQVNDKVVVLINEYVMRNR